MKIVIKILIIITIIIIIAFLKKKYENFRNFEYQNYEKKNLMTPIATNMSSINLGNTNNLQILSPSELKKKLKIFPITKEQNKYKELCGLKYNYYQIKGNKSPLPFVFKNINQILQNQNKRKFLRNLKEKLYDEAQSLQQIKIFK